MVGETATAVDVTPVRGVRAQAGAVKDVVTQNQRGLTIADEVSADDERLCQAFRTWLQGIVDSHAPARAVPEKVLERGPVDRRRDDEHLADPRRHQRRQRVVDRRLVVDRHELLLTARVIGHRREPVPPARMMPRMDGEP